MKHVFRFQTLILLAVLFLPLAASAQTTEFTYQGRLLDNSLPPTANYDFEFSLWNAPANGTQLGTTQTVTGVAVANGIFTVRLDFGNNISPRENSFLQIAVRPAGGGSYTTLAPRQTVTAAPRAINSNFALTADSAANALSADSLTIACNLCVLDGHIQAVAGSKVTGVVANATTANNVSGIVSIANGGTGSSTQNFVDLLTNQTVGGNKSFTGVVSGNGSGLINVPGTLKWNNVTTTSQQALSNNGYFANNFEEVTIMLPIGPAIGDIVRVTGSGTHGWKIAQNGGQAIYLGNVVPSEPASWTPRFFQRDWTDVASSADGTKLIASESLGYLHTSTDSGVTWTERGSLSYWQSVASSADGTKLIAAEGVQTNQLYTSTNSGLTWTPRIQSTTSSGWRAVASSSDGTRLVAAENGAGGFIYTSTNSGVTWTQRGSPRHWIAVDSSADGTKLVAAVNNGRIYTSTDSGVTWVARESDRQWVSVASSADGTKLVAAATTANAVGDRIYTSTDSGVTWTARESNRRWQAVASDASGNRLVAVAEGFNGPGGRIYISRDSGRFWFPHDSDRWWRSVASSATGDKLVGVTREDVFGAPGYIYTSPSPPVPPPPYTSVGTAGYLLGSQFSSIELKYIGGGVFLPISFSGSFIAN